MTDMHPLNPLDFPLQGQQLIEASAGTGKTYTITALYLRLLLGLGNLSDKPLGPEQILVVTFTEAATEELRDRIRKRIIAARRAFADTEESGDALLDQLKALLPDTGQAIKLLEQAARQMDEAAIFTIHGFCQRMLKQHAFESGALFDTELVQDDQPLIRNAVLDFWRNHIYPLNAPLALLVYQHWKSPEQLLSEIRNLLSRSGIVLQPDLADLDLQQRYTERQLLIQQFKQEWSQCEDDLLGLIQQSGVNKRSYTKATLPKWLDLLNAYATSEQGEPDKKLLETLQRFSQNTLNEKSPPGHAPQHPLFELIDKLLTSEVPVKEVMLGRAYREVQARLQTFKQQRHLLTFDDLLGNLYLALENDPGGWLAQAIRTQFPVAMIDEFQDTDPLQYGIFSRLYADPYSSALIMIGDPKQAIYAFRGADIFTYIQARRAVSATYTLDTNWRSRAPMVDAVNQLFQHTESAFIYDRDIAFQPVKAAKGEQTLCVEGQPAAALTFWHQEQDEPLSRSQYLSAYAKATAAEIDHLLSGAAYLGDQPLQGGDIAVLVRDRNEADEIRRALAEYERPCVYLSNRDSVFNSVEAQELALLLQAVEAPQNERAVKAVLTTELFGLDVEQLEQLNRDEQRWEAIVAEFSDYHEVWQQRGVLPMISRVLHQRNLAASTLSRMEGERVLTNVMHLGELLQKAAVEVEGLSGLIRWFNEQIAKPAGESDEQVLRLESERNLVTVVTVHKSKGLEYPVVFLPFASLLRESKQALYHADSGEICLDLSQSEAALEKAEEERLAEDLRLLYVALTRSIYSCYVGVSPVRLGQSKKSRLADSALGYLLLQGERSLSESLAQLQQRAQSIVVTAPPEFGSQKDLFFTDETEQERCAARRFSGKIDRSWRVSSYSALSRHSAASLPELPGLDLEVVDERQSDVAEAVKQGINIYTFPKGANAGTFLHSVFEEISFNHYQDSEYEQSLQEILQLSGYDDQWLPVVQQLIHSVLNANLDGNGLRLANIADSDRLVEMEFMLSADKVRVAELEELIRRYDPLSAQAAPLAFEPLTGMLKGFIDLLFREGERYYVLDYKSNHLGYEIDSYQQTALVQSMVEHRYDLQYILYTLAVHRLLKQRISDYDYDRHFGGVFYLFLRGMQADECSGIFSYRPDKVLIEQLDKLFSQDQESEQ